MERNATTIATEEIGVKDNFAVQASGLIIPKDLLSVLEKFSKKMKSEIEVIALTPENLENKFPIPQKNKIIIYNPVNMNLFYGNAYSVNIKLSNVSIGDPIEKKYAKIKLLSDSVSSIFCNTHFNTITEKNNGTYYSFIIQQEIISLADILSEHSDIKDEFLRKDLLCNMLKVYEEYIGVSIKRLPYDRKILNNYMKFIKNLKSNSKNILKEKMRGIENDIRQHYQAIQRKDEELQNASSFYSSISRKLAKNKQDTNLDAVTKMFEPLLVSNKYEKVEFGTNSIIAYTGLIKIDYKGKTYEIGKFKITINLNGDIQFENLTKRVEDYDHPHIHDRYACFGNIKETVSEMLKNFMFLPLLDLLYSYLCKYTKSGQGLPFVRIGYWGGYNSITWCEVCDAPKTECICNNEDAENTCETCHNHIENCICRRCPSSGEIRDQASCDECEHWDDDNSRCAF